jgi:maltooligosyltrehalose trehalohydrolase
VLYELHIGTFTPAGTWRAAMDRLPHLLETGITTIELMPVAEFPGRFGWGYDGVLFFAPTRLYGTPDDFRAFVDRAHTLGLGVILDVVYNHFGPSGSVVREYSPAYFTESYDNEWGDALNFDGECSPAVREFVVANAGYWIDEFHLDGLRLDATQSIHDRSAQHVVAALTARAREAAGERRIIVVAENEPQEARYVRPPEQDGYGLDAMWNDDFHHSAIVAVTGRAEAYYSIIEAPRRNLSRLRSAAFSFKVSVTRGKSNRGEPAPMGCRRRRSCSSWKITTRSRTRAMAPDCICVRRLAVTAR